MGLHRIFLLPFCASTLSAQKLSWFSASDTHFGHDVGVGANFTTSLQKNIWAVTEMNSLPNNGTWPASLGGGPVLPPLGVTLSGDLIDSGFATGSQTNGCHQWSNFTSIYGLKPGEGLINYRTYAGRGNHDGPNSTATNQFPPGCNGTDVATNVIARNQRMLADPSFNIDGVSEPTGLHFSWTWNITDTCRVHFVHMNLFSGHKCGSASNPTGEGPVPGFLCNISSWVEPEDSLGFLQSDLKLHASGPGVMVVTIQHFGLDAWSNTWYNDDQRVETFNTLLQYNTLAYLVGHTHSAELYSFNATNSTQGEWASGKPGFIDVINAPATQKEDGHTNPLPSEFMVIEASITDEATNAGVLRVAQRVGDGWGPVLGQKNFTC